MRIFPLPALVKGSDLASIDPATNKIALLFHSRDQRWHRHFRLNGGRIEGVAASGRATAALLHLNDPERVAFRLGLVDIGHYPPHQELDAQNTLLCRLLNRSAIFPATLDAFTAFVYNRRKTKPRLPTSSNSLCRSVQAGYSERPVRSIFVGCQVRQSGIIIWKFAHRVPAESHSGQGELNDAKKVSKYAQWSVSQSTEAAAEERAACAARPGGGSKRRRA